MNEDSINLILQNIDVLVDGKFYVKLKDVNAPWVGSTNQRVINVQETLTKEQIVLHNNTKLKED